MSKQPTADPRIAPKEMIVTRNKSAQQRRQLREKDRSMTKMTQLLKTPANKTYKNTKKKRPKSPEKKSATETVIPESENVELDNVYKEYYPDKLRRRIEEKRVFLRPKYESKTVVKLNKRKMVTPQRGIIIEDPQCQIQYDDNEWSPVYKSQCPFDKLSIEEVVRIVEETESLDDEDLMEILTCPSPVWWEDPPDEKYIEDPIYKIVQEKPKKSQTLAINKPRKEKSKGSNKNNNRKSKKNAATPNTTDFITVKNTNDDFLKKRNKLEDLLGNIKNKTTIEPNDVKTGTINNKTNCEIVNDIFKESVLGKKEKNHSESTESFPDLSFNEEDMLKHFENMDIPIAIDCKKEADEKPVVNLVDGSSDVNKDLNSDIKIKNESLETKEASNQALAEKSNEKITNVPSILPRLIKRPKLGLEESPSIKSISDETEISSTSEQENLDTISDTNIRYIIDDDIEIIGDNFLKETKNIKMEVDSSIDNKRDDKTETNMDVLKALSDKKEFITVYKIVSNDTKGSKFKNIPEYSSYVENLMNEERSSEEAKCNGQLNNFFKKCKYASRRKRKEVETKETEAKGSSFCDTCEPKKCITVAQEENVKYCLNCSSIFDTDECSYCLKSKPVKDSDGNQT